MEVKRDEGINIGSNPFYQPSNSTYGSTWQATQNQEANPVKMPEIPLYSDVVSIFMIINHFQKPFDFVTVNLTFFKQGTRELALKNSMRTYKHEALKVMRENGELDTQIYGTIKDNK